MSETPATVTEFTKAWPKFAAWLVERGSAIMVPTNPYELARFSTDRGTGVIYKNEKGRVSNWHNGSKEAWEAFRANAPWRACEKVSRQSKKKRALVASLKQRDGDTRAFCNTALGEDVTIEHFVPVATGGTNHMANLLLAHGECNKQASHLSVREKIEMVVQKRTAR